MAMNQKKVLLLAYTNANFGDDMFIKTICSCFPETLFFLNAPESYKGIFCNEKNLCVQKTPKVIKLAEKIGKKFFPACEGFLADQKVKNYNAVVYVIGGVFDDDAIWEKFVQKEGLKRAKSALFYGCYSAKKPFFLLGSNMTRVRSKAYIKQMEYMFDGLKDICFRDQYSYQCFSHLSNTRYAPDIVFNYQAKNLQKNGSILISVWGPLTRTEQFPQWEWCKDAWKDYENFLIEIIQYFISQGKSNIKLLALCKNEGDTQAAERIVYDGKFENKIPIITYSGNLNEVIGLFEKADFVVGTRFHSIVMALNAESAFYPIVYESKTMQLLNDISYHGAYSHIEHTESYQLKKVVERYKRHEVIDCTEIKTKAKEQFAKLRDYLEMEKL